MTAKEFLKQVRYVDRMIDNKLEQVHRLRDESVKASMLVSDMPRSSSPNLQRMEDTIVRIIDLEREINADIDRLVDMKRAARMSINNMENPDGRMILELRYLCYRSWTEIAEEMGFSESHIYRLHGLALLDFMVPADPEGRDWKV